VNRSKHKGRAERGTFVLIPHAVIDSEAFRSLSPYGVKLLIDVARQYNGRNNGSLDLGWARMKRCGWVSQDSLAKAKTELAVETISRRQLVHGAGLILQTRPFSKGRLSLWAITWLPIDAGIHFTAPTSAPPGHWRNFRLRQNKNQSVEAENTSPQGGELL
jgi:hypothetical protein